MTYSVPFRPRLLIEAAAILVANGGAEVKPLPEAVAAEAEFNLARLGRGNGLHHTWRGHIQALGDLIASIHADPEAAGLAARPPLTIVK